ncbi:hypothetical protein OG883_38770 [Streptomyces sp. NBC_01142]|uniref:hypothetical protein n=1 Tax=Streptomyces sp. NBC_01142 TaxID=2975865 RepID=UPI002254F517|nr:hypothetical protein [Streptomyces sp. NBC_01142]MCX4825688.1 hypothetical protein [Streptomyces sp. NBC_01142]
MLGLRRHWDGQRYRAASERCAVLDPYHVAADRWWPEDDTQAAASQLLLDGLVTVNHRGNLSLTAAGADPARAAGHTLPDALLAALRRRTAPAALGNIVLRDTAFGTIREDFHAACRARLLSGLPAQVNSPCCLACAGVSLLLAEIAFTGSALLDSSPRGPVQWLLPPPPASR